MFGNLFSKKIDTQPALRFLAHFAPDAPWVLRAWRGNGASLVVTLRPQQQQQQQEAAAFIAAQIKAGRSVSMLVAEPAIVLNRLPAPADLRGTRYIGVAIGMAADKRAGDQQAGAAVKALVERLTPKPFVQIATPRGYECWWRLFNLLPLDRAQALAAQWAMRIPGAVPLDLFLDLPDATRKLVQMDRGAIAVATDFMAPPKQAQPETAAPAALDDLEDRPIEWLWPQLAAFGKLNLLGGLPGSGKSQITIAMAAALSTGRMMSGDERARATTLILAREDDAADTIKPRLRAAGADLRRVFVDDGDYDLRQGPDALIQRAEAVDAKLIIFDPIDAYVDGPAASDRRNLILLTQWAAKRQACLEAIIHPPKDVSGKSAQELFSGSPALMRIARSAWIAMADTEDSERRLLLFAKGNIVKDKQGFGYRFKDIQLPGGIATSRLRFETERVRLTADELLGRGTAPAPVRETIAIPSGPAAMRRGRGDGGRNPVAWLPAALEAGPREGKELKVAAAAAGFHHPVLYRARAKLGVQIQPSGERNLKLWRLPR